MKLRAEVLVLMGVLLLGMVVIGGGGVGAETPLRAQAALGVQRVLVLAVSFPNVSAVKPLRQIREQALNSVADYYSKASYGKTIIEGEVKGWYQLPRPLEDYKLSPYNIKVDPTRVRRLVEDAFSAAEKEVNFSQYNHVIIVVGAETKPGVGYGMIAYCANPGMLRAGLMRKGGARMEEITTRGGQRFSGGIVVVAQTALVGHIVHDLAHALGGAVDGKRPLPDLYDTVLQGKVGTLTHETYHKFAVFMGPWDVMSQHFIKRDQPAPGMSSFTRLRMGWIEDSQVVEVTPGESRAVTLNPLGAGQGKLVIKVPARWGNYYLLENRQELPSDPVLLSRGLLVLYVDESKEDGDGIVKVEAADPKVAEFAAAPYGLGAGQTPSASLSKGAAVEILWQQEKNLTVMVTTDSLASEVRALSKRIRELDGKLQGMPPSPALTEAQMGLAAAKELLLQVKVSEARAKVDNTRWP